MLPTHSRHAARSDTSWVRCRLYRMVGNFHGYKFRKTGQNSGFRNFTVLIFTVGESGTRGLVSGTAKS